MSSTSAYFRIWDTLSRFALTRASRIVVLGRCMRDVVRLKVGADQPPIAVLPNWANGEEIFPLTREPNRLVAAHPELAGRFVVQYSGNLGRFHDFETILGAAARLRERDDIRFLIIGDGARKSWLEQQVHVRGLTNILLLPFQPQSELNHSLNAQSVSLVTLERGTEGLCVPSKFYPVLAAGKPVIAVMEEWSEVASVVEEEGVGMVVAQQDTEALASAIEKLSSSPALCIQMGRRARLLQQQKFDRRQAAHRYLDLIRSTQKVETVTGHDRTIA